MATKKKVSDNAQDSLNTSTLTSSETTTNKDAMVQLTGLWLNRTKDGEIYFSGYLGSARLLIFKNKYKEQENHPDYVAYTAPNNKQKTSNDDPNDFEKENDDIPF